MITKYNNFIKEGFFSNLFKVKPEYFGIKEYKFNDDGTLDVFQDVDLSNKNIGKGNISFPRIPFKFNKIDGYFEISKNNLISLENCPKEISKGFACSNNPIKSLEYGPTIVGGNYYITNTFLESLKGAPEIINKSFIMEFAASLNSLHFVPKYIKEDLILPKEKRIGNIETYPLSIIEGEIKCHKQWQDIYNHIKNIIKENRGVFELYLDIEKQYEFHEAILGFDPTLIKYYTQVKLPNKKKRLLF